MLFTGNNHIIVYPPDFEALAVNGLGHLCAVVRELCAHETKLDLVVRNEAEIMDTTANPAIRFL